jgi:hypothetical protein
MPPIARQRFQYDGPFLPGQWKIPEPIMAPTTNVVESNKFRPRLNSGGWEVRIPDAWGACFRSIEILRKIGLTIAYCIHKIQ